MFNYMYKPKSNNTIKLSFGLIAFLKKEKVFFTSGKVVDILLCSLL